MTAEAPLLTWNDNFATGVAEIDEQHMILVHTLNEASVKLKGDASLASLERITQDLLSYALYHFDTEEELMQEYGYAAVSAADAAQHLEQHRAFSAKVVAVRDGIRQGTPIPPDDLLNFLNNWLVNHILNTDKKLGAYVSGRRASSSS